MGNVCIFFADGFEEIEALTVVDLLRRADVETRLVSVTGERTVTGSHQIRVGMDGLFEEMDFSDTEMLVLPGGMPGTRNLEAFQPLMDLTEDFYQQGKKIAAICAAPSILGHRGMLKGKAACSYPDFESHLEGAEVSRRNVEVAGPVITSRGMGTAMDFGLAILSVLVGEKEAEAMAEKIMYKNM